MATLNQNPLINANSDTVSSIVLAHNNHISSIFDSSDSDSYDNNLCDNDTFDEFTTSEIFEMIRNINDPEHPLTLEQLAVIKLENIQINNNKILINYTPTIPHCSMATLIGLSIKVKLLRSLPTRFKIKIKITPGTHQSENEINKQLNDKERVAAAIENYSLIKVVNQCIKTSL
eukprot:367782_1